MITILKLSLIVKENVNQYLMPDQHKLISVLSICLSPPSPREYLIDPHLVVLVVVGVQAVPVPLR